MPQTPHLPGRWVPGSHEDESRRCSTSSRDPAGWDPPWDRASPRLRWPGGAGCRTGARRDKAESGAGMTAVRAIAVLEDAAISSRLPPRAVEAFHPLEILPSSDRWIDGIIAGLQGRLEVERRRSRCRSATNESRPQERHVRMHLRLERRHRGERGVDTTNDDPTGKSKIVRGPVLRARALAGCLPVRRLTRAHRPFRRSGA